MKPSGILLTTAISLCLAFLPAFQVMAQQPTTPPASQNQAEIQQLRQEIKALRQQIAPLHEQIKEANAKIKALKSELNPLREKIKADRKKIKDLRGDNPNNIKRTKAQDQANVPVQEKKTQ